MKVCSNCKSELADNYNGCPNCGSFNLISKEEANSSRVNVEPGSLAQFVQEPKQQNIQYQYNTFVDDSGSIGWGILGFLIPLVGFILYFVWKDKKPACAKVSGIGGILGFVCNIILVAVGVE